MTSEDPFARDPAQSPYAIRHQSFGTRRRGFDPKEVTAYLAGLADQIEYADADRADLRSEVERLRTSATEAEQQAHMAAHAVGLLSEAQAIADTLVAEAQQYAEDLMAQARRDALVRTHDPVPSTVDSRPSMARLVAAQFAAAQSVAAFLAR
ncbi:DivIVA domain-containing protein [Kribbella sp. NPDC051952]|uniref:DivIVA domain-containing protein n=1 Tax=Kribbella sp. NPDC051952 TaxID=3154851 RepID=UPI003434D08A